MSLDAPVLPPVLPPVLLPFLEEGIQCTVVLKSSTQTWAPAALPLCSHFSVPFLYFLQRAVEPAGHCPRKEEVEPFSKELSGPI
jgi:hypothetical protein